MYYPAGSRMYGGVLREGQQSIAWRLPAGQRGALLGIQVSATPQLSGSQPPIPAGVNWAPVVPAPTPPNALDDIAYGNGVWVVVGNGGAVYRSTDGGVTWTFATISGSMRWVAVMWVPWAGLFVAAANNGTTDRIATSPDGLTWTRRTTPSALSFVNVGYGPGVALAVGLSGLCYRSTDCITWASVAMPSGTWNAVTWGAGLFVAVGSAGVQQVATSPDGITWTLRSHPNTRFWDGIAWNGSEFIAVAAGNTTLMGMASPDGITWTDRPIPGGSNGWRDIGWAAGLWVAVGDGSPSIITSTDGITWTPRFVWPTLLARLGYGPDQWGTVAQTPNTTIIMSSAVPGDIQGAVPRVALQVLETTDKQSQVMAPDIMASPGMVSPPNAVGAPGPVAPLRATRRYATLLAPRDAIRVTLEHPVPPGGEVRVMVHVFLAPFGSPE